MMMHRSSTAAMSSASRVSSTAVPSPAAASFAAPRLVCTRAGKGGGFGKTSQKRVDTEGGSYTKPAFNPRLAKELGIATDETAANKAKFAVQGSAEFKDGWRDMGELATLFSAKNTKAVEIGQKPVVLYQYKDKVYCSDALSTAFKYPLIDAKVFDGPDGQPVAEVPLDGTQYNLENGKVVVWCPGTGPIRSVLGAMKKNDTPVNLTMYPVQVVEGKVYAKLYTKF